MDLDPEWTAVAAGGAHWVALHRDGTLWAWGDNGLGRLGNGMGPSEPNPVQVAEGRFRFVQADAFVNFAVSNRLQVVGHCLVWAKDDRTPPWFFRSAGKARFPSSITGSDFRGRPRRVILRRAASRRGR